jgi:hypothetical protein
MQRFCTTLKIMHFNHTASHFDPTYDPTNRPKLFPQTAFNFVVVADGKS